MRFFVLLLMFSLFMSGYCAAAHAFGAISMQSKETSGPMADMPDCPGMQADTGNGDSGHHPAKTSDMACKVCCASLIGFVAFIAGHQFAEERLKFSLFDSAAPGDFRYRIFHPPKSLA